MSTTRLRQVLFGVSINLRPTEPWPVQIRNEKVSLTCGYVLFVPFRVPLSATRARGARAVRGAHKHAGLKSKLTCFLTVPPPSTSRTVRADPYGYLLRCDLLPREQNIYNFASKKKKMYIFILIYISAYTNVFPPTD